MTASPTTPLRVRFLGTGTSTALPVGPCLAQAVKPSRDVRAFLEEYNAADPAERAPERWGGYDPAGVWPKNVPCTSCRAAVDPSVEDGWKNRRGNPSMVLSKPDAEGVMRNVVVDVGKTFREQSCRLFPRWGINRIDAVLITHGHADAYNGLDDLREWNMRQGGAMPIYCTQTTYDTIAATFPYLVDKSKASGGGEIPVLHFNIVPDESEIEICGITVTTVPVPHGRYFHKPALPTPPPPSAPGTPGPSSPGTPAPEASLPAPIPFICLGFVFDRQLVYLSDLSSLPDSSLARINMALRGGAEKPAAAPVLVIDSLWAWRVHTSHVSFVQAMGIALRMKPYQTLLVGMSHPTTHWMWEELGRHIRGLDGKEPSHKDHLLAQRLIQQVWDMDEMKHIANDLAAWGGIVGPAYDGLGLEMTREGAVELPIGQGSAGGWIL